MSYLFKNPGSPFWYAGFDYIAEDGKTKRVQRSTKLTSRKDAQALAVMWEETARKGSHGRLTVSAARSMLSEITERFYSQWVSPWVRFAVTPDSARELRALHPMRVSRKVWSEQVTPALALLPWVQRWLEQWSAQDPHRVENPWYQLERTGADAIGQAMESWRKSRDLWAELVFEQAYAN